MSKKHYKIQGKTALVNKMTEDNGKTHMKAFSLYQ
jgi:hypothetical protein